MLGRLLVPLDGSSFAEAAVPLAVALAERSGGKVLLLHVHEVPAFAVGLFKPPAAEVYLRAVAARSGSDRVVQYEVRDAVLPDEVTEGIGHAAQGWGADLVVMSTHGRGGASRFWLGSVADRYVRASSVPVLLVRPAESGAAHSERLQPKRIVVALDGSELADAGVRWGEALARAFGASLLLLEVITYPGAPGFESMEQGRIVSAAEEEANAHLRVLTEEVRSRGVDARARVVRASSAVAEILQEAGDDPIVVTTRGRGGVARALLGSVADKVVRGGHGPVLVVPAAATAEPR